MSEIRYSMRIKLTDFIKSKREAEVIDAIYKCAESTGKKIFLKLWYKENEVSQKELEDFLLRYVKKLEDIGTNIHMGEHESWTQKSWFNLSRESDKNDSSYRHEYIYSNIQGMIYGIEVFANMIKAMERKSQQPSAPPREEHKGDWKPKHKVVIRRVHNDK